MRSFCEGLCWCSKLPVAAIACQIEERKKLHSALLRSLEDPAAKIKEYNQADNGVTLPSAPASASASPPPPQTRPRVAPPPPQVNRKPPPPARRPAPPPVRPAPSAPPRRPAAPVPVQAAAPLPPPPSPPPAPAPRREEPRAATPVEPPPPAPLAGENVMNVVVVAAECAPWSKTGRAPEGHPFLSQSAWMFFHTLAHFILVLQYDYLA
jgi:hypothetical protein